MNEEKQLEELRKQFQEHTVTMEIHGKCTPVYVFCSKHDEMPKFIIGGSRGGRLGKPSLLNRAKQLWSKILS